MELLLLLLPLLLLCVSLPSHAQQGYINNAQNDCYGTNDSTTLGYTCNATSGGGAASCSAFLTFRASPPYTSPDLLSFLLNSDASSISSLNNLTSDVDSLPSGDLLLIPTTCSCTSADAAGGPYYQHNASFTTSSAAQTYQVIANDTYGGLSTCQALISQNPYNSRNLTVGGKLTVPLRCACPSRNQTAAGFKYLLTYVVTWGDDVPTIAARFRADYQSVLDANSLTSKSVIYPFTTLLIPLKTAPTSDEVAAAAPPPPPSPPPPPPPSDTGGSSKKWFFIGIGIAAAFLVLLAVIFFFFIRQRRRSRSKPVLPSKAVTEPSAVYSEISDNTIPLFNSEIRRALESLVVYRFADLEKATGYFDEDHRIKGSVYRAVINGDPAAVKRLKGNVSDEISILRQINHSSVIRLSGFCIHEGNTYLVYEFAERGSLSDWLHHKKDSMYLNWKQRIQIACNVADGLNYLHNYANPPYVHKDLKSSNILLDGEFRAKVGNFSLARSVEDEKGPQLTRHVVGTQGYMAPEYLEHGLITPKLDVFAFGVVLLELLSGKEAAFPREGDGKGDVLLSVKIEEVLRGEDVRGKLREFMDPLLQDDYPFDLAFAMAELAMRCVAHEHASRPATTEVLMSLSAIYNSTLDWDPSFYASSGSINALSMVS